MNLKSMAYWFWTVFVVRFALAFLFFRDQPKTATLLQGLMSLAFAFLLIVLRLSSYDSFRPLPRPRVIKWVIVYVAWSGISLSWTFSDAFLSAVGYWVMMLLDLLIVMVLLKWDDIET